MALTRSGTSRIAGLGERHARCLGKQPRLRQVAGGQQHDELFAAETAGDAVAGGRLAQQFGEGDDDPVADGMAEAVIDGLEVVEVGDDQGGRQLVLCPPRQRLACSPLEAAAVEQAGQRIGVGLDAQLAHHVERCPRQHVKAISSDTTACDSIAVVQ